MALSPTVSPRKSASDTNSYFNKYNYPLTAEELWFWQSGTSFKKSDFARFQDHRHVLLMERKNKSVSSQKKLTYATPIIKDLSRLGFVRAIFITGALAMSNCPENDDIDIMVITEKNTLWLTRGLISLYLKFRNLRRDPYLKEHSSGRVADKICDNLWLDTDHLFQTYQSLYTAHELLQAKCIFDRGGVHHQLLTQNVWSKKFLPIAYTETLKHIKISSIKTESLTGIKNFIFYILNFAFYVLQYLYMRSHLTTEKIGLGYAYFHPRLT